MFYTDYYHFGKETGNSYNCSNIKNPSNSELLSLISTDNDYKKYLEYLLKK